MLSGTGTASASSSAGARVVAAEPLYCLQGHVLRHYVCKPDWQPLGKRKVWTWQYTCETCRATDLHKAWSCETCGYDLCEDCAAAQRKQ